MSLSDSTTPQRPRPFQFDLRTLLAVTAIVALATPIITWRTSPGALLLAVVAVPILAATICAWNRWPWWIGLVFSVLVSAAATPADPISMQMFAIPASVVYMLSVLAGKAIRKRRMDCAKRGGE